MVAMKRGGERMMFEDTIDDIHKRARPRATCNLLPPFLNSLSSCLSSLQYLVDMQQ